MHIFGFTKGLLKVFKAWTPAAHPIGCAVYEWPWSRAYALLSPEENKSHEIFRVRGQFFQIQARTQKADFKSI